MAVGDTVRVKPLSNAQRAFMYSGWIGSVERVALDGSCYVNSDGPGKMQAVSFRAWFAPDELELVIE